MMIVLFELREMRQGGPRPATLKQQTGRLRKRLDLMDMHRPVAVPHSKCVGFL